MHKKNKKGLGEHRDLLEPLFTHKYRHLMFIGLIFVLLSIFFFKMGYLGFVPSAGDTMQWRASAEVQLEYDKEHKDQALWNSNIFSGMPGYLISYPAKYPFLKNIFNFVTKYIVNWRVFYLFLAGLGAYLLLLSLGFEPLLAFICGIAFALSSHFIGLIEIGHDTKFRAIVYIPLIFYGVHYLFSHRNLLGMGLTAMFVIQQLRENHVQITYYTFIMLLIYWFFSLYWHYKDGKIKDFIIASALFLATLIIAGMAVAQPYLSVREYSHYTIRGGSTGLDTSYATSWSFHPLEIFGFFIPDFFGGISPYYWGWMPFTQTYMYMGIVIFILALMAIFDWKERLVKFFTTVSIVSLLLAFGKHFSILSNLLLRFFPLYNKFRVPSMTLVLMQFSTIVLACFGLKLVIEKYQSKDEKFQKLILRLLIISAVALVLFFALSESGLWSKMLSFSHDSDSAQYEPYQVEQVRQLRFERFVKSGYKSLGIGLIFFLFTFLFVNRRTLSPYFYLLLIAIVIVTDLAIVKTNHLKNLVPEKTLNYEFIPSDTDKYLLSDNESFRIYPIGREFGQNRWGFYHQTIGGYHGAKLKRYQEIIERSLNAELRYNEPINWNIVNMLNVKYIISPFQLPFNNLKYTLFDKDRRVSVYVNEGYLPRAWFVDEVEFLPNSEDIFRRLNSIEFDPQKTAIVETGGLSFEKPTQSNVDVLEYDLHNIKFSAETDKEGLLVVSEIYYPAGWNAYIDGKKVDIIPVNYILRGVVVPPGSHTLEMKFEPTTYKLSLILSLIGILSTLILLILGIHFYVRKNFRGEIVFVIKSD